MNQEQSNENGFIVTDCVKEENDEGQENDNVVTDDNIDSSKSVNITENATSKALDSDSCSKKVIQNSSTVAYAIPPPSPSPSQNSQNSDQENNGGIVNGPLLPTQKSLDANTKKIVTDETQASVTHTGTTTTMTTTAAAAAEANLIFVNQ